MSQATAAPPIEDSPEVLRKRRNTVAWVVGLSFVGLVFDGYDLVVYGAVLPRLVAHPVLGENLSLVTAGNLGAYAMIGVMVGALIAGSIGDLFGRRTVMLVSYGWFSVGMLFTAWAGSVLSFGVWRFLTGLGVGALVATTGAIVSEFAPPGKKNLATAFTYAGVPVGSLLSALLAIFILPAPTAAVADQTSAFRILFMIGALPLVTILPLAVWKMPESVAWLASRGKTDKARKISERTGVPIPEAPTPAAQTAAKTSGHRAGWAGLFGDYLIATILIGLLSVACLLLVYSLNTWLPKLMLPIMGSSKSLVLLLVLNGGALFGTLFGSRFADKYGPQRIVALGMLIGAAFIGITGLLASTITLPSAAAQKAGETADVSTGMLIILLITVAVVGLGTSGTQTLIFGMAANYYRTNVRGAGVAWTAGFGRIGGILGPIIGGALAVAFATNLPIVFYILAAIGLAGMVFTLLIPKPKAEAVAEQIEPSVATMTAAPAAAPKSRLYETIMVVVDETGNELTRTRVSEFVSLTGLQVHLVYLAPELVMSGEVAENDVVIDPRHVSNLQTYVDEVSSQGIPVTGQVLTATLFGRGDAVVDLAQQLRADLIILNTEEGGQRAKAQLAEEVAKSNPTMAVLIARSTR